MIPTLYEPFRHWSEGDLYNVEKYIQADGICTEIYPYVVSELEVQDIDTEVDWKIAELKYKLMKENV